MRQGCITTILLVAAFVVVPAAHAAELRAGVASVDASWHVGASAGQYASDGSFAGEHGLDPTTHSTRRSASYGIQSRLNVRAVVEGPDGKRIALVKNDLYRTCSGAARRSCEPGRYTLVVTAIAPGGKASSERRRVTVR